MTIFQSKFLSNTYRLAVFSVGLVIARFIDLFIQELLDIDLSIFWGLISFYIISAYLVLPWGARLIARSIHKRHKGTMEMYSKSVDGLPCDPINMIVIGRKSDLKRAFRLAGWSLADSLDAYTTLRMARSFIFNRPYPTAPFSWLYYDGKKQDLGFQQDIDNSPRKRHHIRFWGLSLRDSSRNPSMDKWIKENQDHIRPGSKIWIGSGTKDTGLGLTKFSLQISHSVDSDTDKERLYLAHQLKSSGLVAESQHLRIISRKRLVPLNRFTNSGIVHISILK